MEPEHAFHALERSRAPSFLTMLAERDLVLPSDQPPDVQHARMLNAKEYDQVQAQLFDLNPAIDDGQIDKLQTRLRGLNSDRERLITQIRQLSPRFAALHYPQPLDLPSTRQILDPGTVLLSYSVGVEHVLLFVVQPMGNKAGLSVITLPIGESASGRRWRVSAGDPTARWVKSTGSDDRRAGTLRSLDSPGRISSWGRRPVADHPHGPLHVLPFAV